MLALISSPYILPKYVDKLPISQLDTVMYVDPITRQTFEYANQIPCENNPQNIIAFVPDTVQYYVLTPETPQRFFNLLKSESL